MRVSEYGTKENGTYGTYGTYGIYGKYGSYATKGGKTMPIATKLKEARQKKGMESMKLPQMMSRLIKIF